MALTCDGRRTFDVGFSLEIARPSQRLGCDSFGWSYSACDGMARHQDIWTPIGDGRRAELGDVIGCGFNLRTKTIFFTRNGKFLGRIPHSNSTVATDAYARVDR